jgi:hypothetical protein
MIFAEGEIKKGERTPLLKRLRLTNIYRQTLTFAL